MIGTLLGHYRILELLGTGGMGQVYLADDTRLQRQVALKVLTRELALDPDRRERFEREARAAAALNHPNIVTIHSVEEADGVPFLTLELIDGQTLEQVIPPEGLPLDRVLDLAIPLADAVGAAHQRGITHRDLKPANVMLTRDGRLKVLDFGLAKLKEEARLAAEAGMTAALTSEGRIVGTVAYMSPEQAEGKSVDQRSDVFSLGVVLYEMATGGRPFKGDTHMSILSSIIKDTPTPIAEVRRGLPRELSKIINRCLAKDVEDRYQTAKDLRNDLRALKNELTSGEIVPITGSTETKAPPSARRSWRMPAILATAAVLLTVLISAAVVLWRTRAPAASATRPFDSINLTRLTTTGTARLAAMSNDGRYVAHVTAKGGQQSLLLRQVATTSNVEIVPPAEARYIGVAFSPDGNHIYYATYGKGKNIGLLYQVPVLGGGSRLILEDVDTVVSFSPDGKEFAFVRGFPDEGKTAVMVASSDGSKQRAIATRTRPLRFPTEGVAWAPDGRSIAVTGANASQLRGDIVVVDVASGSERVLATPDWRQISRVAWLPDGSGILATAQESAAEGSSQVFLVSYPSGSARRITNDLSTYFGLSVAPDGRSFVCIRNERLASIWTMPLTDASAALAISADAGADDGIHGVSWSPDGRIVYTTDASGNPDIWIMNGDGSRRVQLTSTQGQDMWPRVTSDGKYIVFISDRDGGLRAWRMGLDGSGALRLSGDQIARSRASVSTDGKWVYYSELSSDDSRKVSIDGGTSVSVFSADDVKALSEPLPRGFHEPMLAPDGALVAGHYADATAGGERIVLIPTKGGPLKKLPTVPPTATWAPDGRSLVYIDSRAGVSNLMRYPIASGVASPLTKFTSDQIFNYALSPDQRQAALVRGRESSDVVLVSTGPTASAPTR